MNGLMSNHVGKYVVPISIQTILETVHFRSLGDVWRPSILLPGRMYSKSHFPPGMMKRCLTDLEVVPSEDTCSWGFNEFLRRQVQVTAEQLVHRGKSSTREV